MNDRGIAIGVKPSFPDNVIVAGTFFDKAAFTKNDGTRIELTSAGSSDIFIAQYQLDTGDLLKVTQAGGDSTDFVNNLTVPGADFFITGFFQNSTQYGTYDLRITGTFQNTVTFDGNPPRTIKSNGLDDIFVARYGEPSPDDCTSPERLPSNVVATAVGSRRINITWKDNSIDEDEFIIMRDSTGTGSFVEIARVPSGTEAYSDTTVVPEISYIYRIDVQCPGGVGEGGTDGATTIEAPAGCSATAQTDRAILLTWQDVSNKNLGYRIARSTRLTDPVFPVIDSVGAQGNSYRDGNVLVNTAYFYRIWSYRGANRSDSCIISATTLIASPSVPTLVFPANGANGISTSPTLQWSAASDAESYQLQVSTTASFSVPVFFDQSEITATFFTVPGLLNSTQYFWRVNAVNAGGTSDWSNIWRFGPAAAPPLRSAGG